MKGAMEERSGVWCGPRGRGRPWRPLGDRSSAQRQPPPPVAKSVVAC